MTTNIATASYEWRDANYTPIHNDLLPIIDSKLTRLNLFQSRCRLFDLGCGNGAVTNYYSNKGFDVVGVEDGIQQAEVHYPGLRVYSGSAYDDLASHYGQVPIVLSLEVVEHLYSPRTYAQILCNFGK